MFFVAKNISFLKHQKLLKSVKYSRRYIRLKISRFVTKILMIFKNFAEILKISMSNNFALSDIDLLS